MTSFLSFVRLRCVWGIALALGAFAGPIAAGAGTAFSPNANGNVYASLVLADGTVVIGGNFTAVHPSFASTPQPRERLAVFAADGSLRSDYNPRFNNDVTSLAVDDAGRLLVGGKFSSVYDGDTEYVRQGLVRILPSGKVDATFAPQFFGGSKAQPAVSAIAVQEDGHILVGGAFRTARSSVDGTDLNRARLARLDTHGVIDPDWDPQANNTVFAIAVQGNGGFLVGGGFTSLTPAGGSAVTRTRIARFFGTGKLDPDFDLAADNIVRCFAFEADGGILIGGDFLQLRGTADDDWVTQLFLARVDRTGVRSTDFHPRPNGPVKDLAVQRNGRILVAGNFTVLDPFLTNGGYSRRNLARLLRSGDVDGDFVGHLDAEVTTISLQTDGQIVVGGYFSNVIDGDNGNSIPRYRVARLRSNGKVQSDFNPTVDGTVYGVTEMTDGRLVIVGTFGSIAGIRRSNIAILNADGSVDPDFAPEVSGAISDVHVQTDGRIVIAGTFTKIGDDTQAYLARLNADGTLDASYDPQPSAAVYTMIPESDGSLTVGGAFTQFTPGYDADTSPDDYEATGRLYLARINSDGTINSWNPSAGGSVYTLVRESDGALLVGGAFSSLAGTGRNYIGRLKANDKIDANFNPSPDGAVHAIAVQSDGAVLFGGDFTTLQLDDKEGDDDDGDELYNDDASRLRLARVNADGSLDLNFQAHFNGHVDEIQVTPDGKILVAGSYSQFTNTDTDAAVGRSGIVRLNGDGSLDTTFDWFTDNFVVELTPLSDGSVILGGAFTSAYDNAGHGVATDNYLLRYAADGTIDRNWAVHVPVDTTHYASAISIQRNGKVIVGGSFNQLAGSDHHNLVRLRTDGTRDDTLYGETNGAVHALLTRSADGLWSTTSSKLAWLDANGADRSDFSYSAVSRLAGNIYATASEADGSVLIAGSFYDDAGTVGINLVRLRPDGTFDLTFRPEPSASVTALKVQPDGRILLVGSFLTVDGQDQAYIARIHPDGTLDTGFRPVPQSTVAVVNLQSDGKVLIGGSFKYFNVDDGEGDDDDGDGATDDDTGWPYLARLNDDGSLDKSFTVKPNGQVNAIAVDASNNITLGGQFTTITIGDTSTSVTYLGRVSSAAVLDVDFDPTPNGYVNALTFQTDGKLLVGGNFTLMQWSDGEGDDDDGDGDEDSDGKATGDEDADVFYIARLNPDNTLDATFKPNANYTVSHLALQSDGHILVAGYFTAFFPHDTEVGIKRNLIARLDADGEIDLGFNPNPNSTVRAVSIAADDSIIIGGQFDRLESEALLYVGGAFTTVEDQAHPYLARMHPDGSVDGSYNPVANGTVYALATQADGRLLVAGDFTSLWGIERQHLARLASDGSLDSGFAPNFDGSVQAIGLGLDATIVVAGDFGHVNGIARSRLARLSATGALDASFAPVINGSVAAVVQQPDGAVVIAGAFTQVNGQDRPYLARLKRDGSLDTSFTPVANAAVSALALRTDGGLVIGGAFTTINGAAAERLAVLAADGSLTDEISGAIDGEVLGVAIDQDGSVLTAGRFGTFLGASRYLIGRTGVLSTAGDSVQILNQGGGLTWSRTGGAPEIGGVELAVSTDGVTWTSLGRGTRAMGASDWSWSGLALPLDTTYALRLRSLLGASRWGSGGVLENYWSFTGTTPAGYGYADTLPLSWLGRDTADGVGSESGNGDGSGSGGDPDGGSGGGSGGGDVIDVLGSRFVDIACRVSLSGAESLTLGFVIEGDADRQVLLRGVGPGLSEFGTAGVMAAPSLLLRDQAGASIAANKGWSGSVALRNVMARVGAFPLEPGSFDAAVAPTLAPGAYSLIITDQKLLGGVVLAEVYDTGTADVAVRVANLSSLGKVGSGDASFVAGFVIAGNAPRKVLIRGIGPTLTGYGVADAVSDTTVTLFRADGSTLAENDNWGAAANADDIAAAAAKAGAFALDRSSADSAVLVELAPGSYTVLLARKSGNVGRGLIEIYDVRD